ncbi:hypothetical protein LC607_11990 [Nostoc sp. CHAB 5824]|nr:hypothetical protein [Nostoc sp. CHAB 5824]
MQHDEFIGQVQNRACPSLDGDAELATRPNLETLGESVDLPDAVHHTRVFIEVLSEAISSGEINDIRSQLSSEFDRLFEVGRYRRMRVNI